MEEVDLVVGVLELNHFLRVFCLLFTSNLHRNTHTHTHTSSMVLEYVCIVHVYFNGHTNVCILCQGTAVCMYVYTCVCVHL